MKKTKKTETQLEKEFKDVVEAHQDEIKQKLKISLDSLREAQELSEKYGLPFETSISEVYNQYTPRSFKGKFSGLDEGFMEELLGHYAGTYSSGWQHSTQNC